VNERGDERIQYAKRREQHAGSVDEQGAHEILLNNATAAARDTQRLHELEQIVSEQHDVSRLSRDLRPRPHRDSDLRLRERRCVVDAVADHRDPSPHALERLYLVEFLVRKHLGEELVDVELLRHVSRDVGTVPRQEDGAKPHAFEGRDRGTRLAANDILDLEGSQKPIFARDEDACRRGVEAFDVDAELLEERAAADRDRFAGRSADDALARRVLEPLGLRGGKRRERRPLQDRLAKRMLRRSLGDGRGVKEPIGRNAGRRMNADHLGLAERQRPRLVEHDRVHVSERLGAPHVRWLRGSRAAYRLRFRTRRRR